MDYYDYSSHPDGFLDEVEAWDFDIEQFLEKSQEKERQRLENELERIEDELARRDRLHKEVVDELEMKMNRSMDRLDQLYAQFFAPGHEERERLKNRIEGFYQELRREKRNRWRDRQELEKERRAVLNELDQVEDENLLDLL